MTPAPDIHALTGPYVLDAISDLERVAFEQHLAGCEDCAAEVDDLREAVTKLSLYVARQPPASLRSKVLTDGRSLRPPVGHGSFRAWLPSAGRAATNAQRWAAGVRRGPRRDEEGNES